MHCFSASIDYSVIRKRSLERQDTMAQYDDYIESDCVKPRIDDVTSLYTSSAANDIFVNTLKSGNSEYSHIVPGGDILSEDRQWDSGGYEIPTSNLLPSDPITNSFSLSESIAGGSQYRGAVLPPTPSYKKTRLLPQPQSTPTKMLSATPRMLPQMPPIHSNNQICTPSIRRTDTEYSDQDSSTYSYRPGAVSAMQYNEDYNYAYQSTDSLNTSALSECGGRRKGAALPSVPNSQNYKKCAQISSQHSTICFDMDNTDQHNFCNADNIPISRSYYANGDNIYDKSDSYSSSPIERKSKRLPDTPQMKQLPQIPTTHKSNNKLFTDRTRKRLPVVNKANMSKATDLLDHSYSSNYSAYGDGPFASTIDTISGINLETSNFSSNNNSEQTYDVASTIDALGTHSDSLINNSCYTDHNNDYSASDRYEDDSFYPNNSYYGTNSSITYNMTTSSQNTPVYNQSTLVPLSRDSYADDYTDYTSKLPYDDMNGDARTSHLNTTSMFTTNQASASMSMASTTSFMKSSLGYAAKIATSTASATPSAAAGHSTLAAAGNIGASITSSIGIGISKTLSSMFQSKAAPSTSNSTGLDTNDHSATNSIYHSSLKTTTTNIIDKTVPSITNVTKNSILGCTAATIITTNLTTLNNPDDEIMNEVSGNIVDYNSGDYKYIYDEYSENDYIATGDIITSNKNSYNNNYTDYCTSDADINSILDSETTHLNNLNNFEGLNNTLTTTSSASILNNKNICDKTTSNNVYNLINSNVQQKALMSTDPAYSIYNDGSYNYLNGTSELGLIGKGTIDPSEVYTEDYEDEYARPEQTTSSAIIHNYNQSYQTPYYNYQDDYFNEEDEYKYLEKEREEEQNMDNNENVDQIHQSVEKKQHMLRAQESISDSDFFLQHLEGGVKPHLSYLNKQESIIEEVEPTDDQDEYEETIKIVKTTSLPTGTTNSSTISSMGSAVTSNMTSRPLSLLAAMTTTTTAQAVSTNKPGDIVNDMIGAAVPTPSSLNSMMNAAASSGSGDATAMMMAAAKLATTATGPATTTKVDDVIEDVTKKKHLGSIDETAAVTTTRKSGVTPRQRWHWAYNKLILQLNVSTL